VRSACKTVGVDTLLARAGTTPGLGFAPAHDRPQGDATVRQCGGCSTRLSDPTGGKAIVGRSHGPVRYEGQEGLQPR
jgi:hypothetical protein